MPTKRVHLKNHEEALELFGQNDQYLRDLEHLYHVQFFVRPSQHPSGEGLTLAIRGKPSEIDKAIAALTAKKQTPASFHLKEPIEKSSGPYRKDTVIRTVTGFHITPRTPNQKDYINAMRHNDMVISIGPAGTGKTFLAVAFSLAEMEAERFRKIVLSRPVVEAGEKLGFLPGDLYEKVHPYLRPLYDAFFTIIGPDRFRLMRENEVVEIVPLAYMRGRTLDNAIIILDEAQNTTPEQMKMFLTRMGNNSKMIINGDLTQIDLENKKKSGLLLIQTILKNIADIHFTYLTGADVIRHKLVQKVIDAYETYENREGEKKTP
ncbi:MAG: PhoH family protein [Elusimicrobia bacterium]|nr:PhoH family protein [Candidatus Obscuribacterium magneticum]